MKTILVTLQAKEEYMLKDVLEELRYHEYIQDGSVKAKVMLEGVNYEKQKMEKKS